MFSFLRSLFAMDDRADGGTAAPIPLGLEQRLKQLREARPLPPELAVAPSRPDVWGTTGKLGLEVNRSRFKPLLLNGYAAMGIVYDYKSWGDADERTVQASYAWLDQTGRLRTQLIREEYDPHCAWSGKRSTGLVDVDAELALDKVVIILQDSSLGPHVLYEFLAVNPNWQQELGVFCLQWEPGAGYRRARASRSPGEAPLFTIEREEGSEGGWRLLRESRLQLRSVGEQPLGEGGVRRLLDAQGGELGQVLAKDQRLQLTHPPRVFSLTQEPNRLWLIRDRKDARVLGIWPDDKDERLWHLVAYTRLELPVGELLALAFVAGEGMTVAASGPPGKPA